MNPVESRLENVTLVQRTYILWALAYCIPLVLSSHQLITGTIINSLLFLAAPRRLNKEILPVIILPSFGAITHGILFGPQTVFLYYFIPCIWLANYVLIWIYTKTNPLPSPVRIVSASLAKYLILQTFAYIYFSAYIVPRLFVSSMGYMQLLTAISGGLIAYGIRGYLQNERKTNTY